MGSFKMYSVCLKCPLMLGVRLREVSVMSTVFQFHNDSATQCNTRREKKN